MKSAYKITSEYDDKKDISIKKWHYKQGRYSLEAGVYIYADGLPKLQIGPRKYGDRIIRIGRLTLDETVWVSSIMDEVIELLEELEADDD